MEIEEVIEEHPGVREVGVFGKPDPMVQELITAVVSRKQGYEHLTEEEIISFVDSRVDDYKRLRGGVVFVDSLPRNPIGKVTRKELPILAEMNGNTCD